MNRINLRKHRFHTDGLSVAARRTLEDLQRPFLSQPHMLAEGSIIDIETLDLASIMPVIERNIRTELILVENASSVNASPIASGPVDEHGDFVRP